MKLLAFLFKRLTVWLAERRKAKELRFEQEWERMTEEDEELD